MKISLEFYWCNISKTTILFHKSEKPMYKQLLLEGEDFLIKIQMLTALSRFCDLYQMWKVRDSFFQRVA